MTGKAQFANVHKMKAEFDVLFVAARLVEEMGEAAARFSRARLVETTAANEVPAAEFWREVMKACETILAQRAATDKQTVAPSA